MSEIHFMTGIASTGKSTRMLYVVEMLKSRYSFVELIESHYMSKKDIYKDFSVGLYFEEVNTLALGRTAKIRNDNDRWTSFDGLATYGLRMNEIDNIIKQHNDKIIISEGNIDYSPNRKLPNHLHTLGFDKVFCYCLMFDEFETFFERLNERRVLSGRTPVTMEFAVNKFNNQNSTKKFIERFDNEKLSADKVFEISASSPVDSFYNKIGK
tara:strand:+ start:765 stop:1397 length:633 start_codon:yes stop_codon:yes gene_type:complete